MFDANAAGIDVGVKFFAEVHSVSRKLIELGISTGDILLCEHLEVRSPNPRHNILTNIWKHSGAKPIRFEGCEKADLLASMVYSGTPDGNNFICEEWRSKALKFLGGNWDD